MWNPFKKIKIQNYKRKSLKEVRSKDNRLYRLHFSFLLLDDNDRHEIENLEIVIPARSAFDAKEKLMVFLKRKVGYHLYDIDVVDDK